MGIFLKATFDSQGGSTSAAAALNQEALTALVDGLGDYAWQNSIAARVNGLDPSVSHIALNIVIRLYRPENIAAGGLKTYRRYRQAEEKLVIDQVLSTAAYEGLALDRIRASMCEEVLAEVSAGVLAYRKRFSDFDAQTAAPLLEQRLRDIARG